jgi:uncharacterized membrane protein
MAEHASEHIDIEAPIEQVHATLLAFERYPEWARDLREVEVLDRDEQGRGTRVRFRAAAIGRSASYTLHYDHADAPHRLPWALEDGDVVRELDGAYVLQAVDGDPKRTRVTWSLDLELLVPLPGFVKRRIETLIVKAALPELKAHVESGA